MFKIGDKVRIIGGTHFKKKQPIKWGYVKSQTKTFCKIDYHNFTLGIAVTLLVGCLTFLIHLHEKCK